MEIRQSPIYSRWFRKLRDRKARNKILARVRRLSLGNPGDVASVGSGVSELRIHYGPGYRVYYTERGGSIVILLAGGDKRSQRRDIEKAIELAKEL